MTIYRGAGEAADSVLVSMVAEVLLVCAVALGFFVQLALPPSLATGGAIAALFIGSLFCWRSQLAAGSVLVVSLLSSEVMLALRFPVLVLPFALADILLVMVVSGAWHTSRGRAA